VVGDLDLSPDEAWRKYCDRVNAVVAQIQYGDPTTHDDDRVVASNWEQMEAFKECWRIVQELREQERLSGGVSEGEEQVS
jgi:hypothetical protein